MKRTLLLTVLYSLLSEVFAQVQLFKDFDFNSGEYSILGIFSESDRNTLRDSLGEFYTDDTAILNQFKNTWIFDQPGKRYACGYHYSLFVCKNGVKVQGFSINLNCEEIIGDEALFHFDANLLRQFYGKLKKPHKRKTQFTAIQTAKDEFHRIIKDTSLILSFQPDWLRFEGSFRFTYHCQSGTQNCLSSDSIMTEFVRQQITAKYPTEAFELYSIGGSLNTIEFGIKCNESLSKQFDLFERNFNYFGKWSPFSLKLESYWK
jgi:hypothetical protein